MTLAGQALVGWKSQQAAERLHGASVPSLPEYLGSAPFAEAVFENWESEFFQMGLYVVLTALLFQRGSSESKDPDKGDEAGGKKPARSTKVPWPVRRGGLALRIYRHSLSLAFLLLFLVSFVGHWLSGAAAYNEELRTHGAAPLSTPAYLGNPQFWFESLQNWQSEFLAVLSIVLLSIWLREEGSPESKPVEAPHNATGK